jgi:ElaB/YqjD/DUF883 family membrane-anchored ribosome-binding protein
MVEQTTPLRGVKDSGTSDTIDRMKSEVDQLIDSLDLREASRRIQDFGRENPFALAVASLTVGLAAGLLMRRRPDFVEK